MKEQVRLEYLLVNKELWIEKMELKVPLDNLTKDTQFVKILSTMVPFFLKMGFSEDFIIQAFEDVLGELVQARVEKPNCDSTDKEIDSYNKKVDEYYGTSFTFEKFQKEAIKNQAFREYLYQIYLDDDNEKVMN